MKLFGNKDTEEKKDKDAVANGATEGSSQAQGADTRSSEDLARVLMHPRITEKATLGTEYSVYVFDVAPDANKIQIKRAVKEVYNVEARKVRITKVPKKSVRNARTGIKGVKSGGKKAYVYLKKGESISIM